MSKLYECMQCNYVTKSSGNLSHHNKTKKHLKNTNNISEKLTTAIIPPIQLPYNSHTIDVPIAKNHLQCDYCDRVFTRYDNLGRHMKSCATKHKQDKENDLKKQLCEYDHKIALLNCKLDEYKHFEEDAKYYKQMLMEAGGLVKKSVSALTYSITNYDTAPHIKSIQMDDVDTFNNPDKEIVEDILSAHKHKTLNSYIGKLILKLYKKGNPLDQSIWNTDNNRLTYIIKELLNDNSSNWIVDKKGVKTIEYLINPLLLYIKKLIISYQKDDIPKFNPSPAEMEMTIENSKAIVAIVNGIDDDMIAKDVLKYISVHLRFNDKNLKLK